ncbi:PilN domain-containing protein [Seongchinamella unica]|nr:PilN domain-containing protein [Seongchinamella unica]
MQQLKAAWHWWLAELSALAPKPLIDFFATGTAILRVQAVSGASRFVLRTGQDEQTLGEIDLLQASPDELQAFARQLGEHLTLRPQVQLAPPAEAFLEREAYLPLTVEANLPTVLRFEIDRLMPFGKGDALFGYRVLQRHPEEEKLAVELYVISRQQLAPYLDRLSALGLAPEAVLPPSATGTRDDATLNLLPEAQRAPAEPYWNREVWRAFLLAMVLAVATLALPAWYYERSIGSIQPEIEQKRADADRVAEKRGLVLSQLLARQAIAARKNEAPGKLELLLALTRVLPDNTWVSRLHMERKKLVLSGESDKASDLIGLLEQSDYFRDVQFRSPITSNPRTGSERYEIEVDLAEMAP